MSWKAPEVAKRQTTIHHCALIPVVSSRGVEIVSAIIAQMTVTGAQAQITAAVPIAKKICQKATRPRRVATLRAVVFICLLHSAVPAGYLAILDSLLLV